MYTPQVLLVYWLYLYVFSVWMLGILEQEFEENERNWASSGLGRYVMPMCNEVYGQIKDFGKYQKKHLEGSVMVWCRLLMERSKTSEA